MYKYTYVGDVTRISLTTCDINAINNLYNLPTEAAGFAATGAPGSVNLTWQDLTPASQAHFIIKRADACGRELVSVADIVRGDSRYTSNGIDYHFSDQGVNYAHPYYYSFTDGQQLLSAIGTPTDVPAGNIPSAPAVVRTQLVAKSDGTLWNRLSWARVDGAVSYEIISSVSADFGCGGGLAALVSVADTTDSVQVVPGDERYVGVRAANAINVSGITPGGRLSSGFKIGSWQPSVLMCPGGDGPDTVALDVAVLPEMGIGDELLTHHVLQLVRDSVASENAWLWSSTPGAVGRDTVTQSTFDIGRQVGHFTIAYGFGCGKACYDLMLDDSVVCKDLVWNLRSFDNDAHSSGAVDRYDYASLEAAMGEVVGGCWDLDGLGAAVGQGDFEKFAGHYLRRDHLPRKVLSPAGGNSFGPGETMPISWVRGYGDSARVTLRMFNPSLNPDTVMIARDLLDTGTYNWIVPTGRVPFSGYLVQVVHTAGYYGVDYMDVGIATADAGVAILPVPVSNLTATAAKTTCALSWTEPGQAGHSAASYDIRFRTDGPITESNWSTSTQIAQSVLPNYGGTVHCLDLSVTACRTYYFAMKTKEAGLSSRLSNVATAQTRCSGNQLAYCDAQGLIADGSANAFGLRARRYWTASVGGHPVTADSTGADSTSNSLLWRTSRGQVSDLYKYPVPIEVADGQYPIALEETGDLGAQIDQATLGVVDHSASVEAFPAAGQVLLGSGGGVASLTDGQGAPIALGGAGAGAGYDPVDGDYVNVDLGAGSDSRALILSVDAPNPQAANDSSGVWIEVPSSDSSWTVAGVIHPRRQSYESAVDIGINSRARIHFRGSYELTSLSSLSISDRVSPAVLTMASAVHSRLGNVSSAISQLGGGTTELDPGDTLSFTFQATPVPAGQVRDLFLGITGLYTIPTAEEPLAPTAAPMTVAQSFAFELGQARPNPSAGQVTFGFTLANQTNAVLRLYDVAGRLVRDLARDQLAPGPHEVVWDGTDQSGRRAAPGVYFYRLQAGAWSSQKKLVVIRP